MKKILISLFVLFVYSFSYAALYCDGIDDYADCGNNPIFHNSPSTWSFTVTAWVKPKDFSKAGCYIAKYDNQAVAEMVWWFGVNTSRATFYMPKEQITAWTTYGPSVVDKVDVWYHFAFTYSANSDKAQAFGTVYTNGMPGIPTVRPYASAKENISFSLKFGAASYNLGATPFYSKVVLYDVRIFNKALSRNEIIDVMYNNVGITSSTISMWKLDSTNEVKYYDVPNKVGVANFIGAVIVNDTPPVVTNFIDVKD